MNVIQRGARARLLASTLLAGMATVVAPVSVVAIASLVPTMASAQDYTSGILSGSVTDENGSPLAGATVSVTSAQGTTRTARTDSNGGYRIPALPVGVYSASVSAAGFPSLSGQTVSVSPGGSAYAFTMTSAASVSELVITATRRVQDFAATDTGLSVDVQELSGRVPLGRSINSAVNLAPGVGASDPSIAANGVRRNQSAVTLSGTSAAESVYYINGLNVTDQRTFLGYADLPYEFIQTVDAKTGGYAAEYGRGTGGVINIVTRSGSNEFHFGGSAYWTPDMLRASRGLSYAPGGNNSVGQTVLNQYSKANSSEQTIWASGPIVQDHIFFFLLYNARQNDSTGAIGYSSPTAGTGTQTTSTYNDPRLAAKFDFVLNENHRLEVTMFSDESTTDYQPYTVSRATNGITVPLNSYNQKSGGFNQIYKYTGVFTDWFTLSALYGRTQSDYLDYGPNVGVPGIRDYGKLGGSYATSGVHAGPYNLVGEDDRKTYRIDADFYFNLLGDHHLRVGYDKEDLLSTAVSAYSGGALYYAWAQDDCPATAGVNGCIDVITFANIGDFKGEQTAWYVQDSWDITPDFSVQLGVRADIYDYMNSSGQTYISIDNQYAPRIGFNWDPIGNGVDRIYGSMGDYYLPIATNTSIRASSGEVYTEAYYQTTRAAPGCTTASAACGALVLAGNYPTLGAQIGTTDYFSPPGGPDPRTVVESGLEPMYEREFVLGYEHKFREGYFADWTGGVRYVNRQLQSTIEDTAIGDAVTRYCTRNAIATCNADPSVYPYILINPGDGARVFIDLEGDTIKTGAGLPNPDYNGQWINLTTADLALPEVERKYEALQFTFERPFDGRWGVQGSYVLARSEGNYEGAVKSDVGQTDTSITQDFDHASNTLYSNGLLPNDRKHTFKVFGTYSPMDWLIIGANFTAQSGRPYGCIGYVPGTVDPLAPDSGTPSGWMCPQGTVSGTAGSLNAQLVALGITSNQSYNSIPTPRGSAGTTDWTYQVDMTFAFKIMDSAENGKLTASVDIFNLFDGDAVTRVVEQGEVRTSSGGAKGVRAPYYGLPRTYQSPRSVRFGLKYAF
ncbi:MAG: TonB-dependent receptor [Caulobacter sp.]|nr:TonB-dependent receptor [Caulobacter sp.]